MLAHFLEGAKSLIEELGAEQALCSTLACMTGHTEEMRARSLLSNSDNFVTVMRALFLRRIVCYSSCPRLGSNPPSAVFLQVLFKSPQAISHTSYVWSFLRNKLDPSATQALLCSLYRFLSII